MNLHIGALRSMAVAIAIAGAMGHSAFALTPQQIESYRRAGWLKEVVIHGASAQTNLVEGYMGTICTPGTLDTYTSSPSGHKAYACDLFQTVPGTGGWPAGTHLILFKRDKGGSIYGVTPLVRQQPEFTMVVANDDTCVEDPPPSARANDRRLQVSSRSYTCTSLELRQAIAGISDVEPAIFSLTTTDGTGADLALNVPNGASANDDNGIPWLPVLSDAELSYFDTATANQTIFGIAVSNNLRDALQATQGLPTGSSKPADAPSVPRAFYTAVASGFIKSGDAKSPGWDALTGVPADNARQVNLCRDANGSGTLAASNLFFLGAGSIARTASGALIPLESNSVPIAATGAPLAVTESASTAGVINCLKSAAGLGAYAIGIVSFENIPSGNWSFVKLDGVYPSQAIARIGGYPFVFSAAMQWVKKGKLGAPDTATILFLSQMRKSLGSPASIAGLTSLAAQQGVLAQPRSYDGSCASAIGNTKLYGSCVERLDFLSPYNDGVLFYGLAPTATYKTNSLQSLHVVK